jgi:hypothetical protein
MHPASVVPFPAPLPTADPLGTRLVISDRPGERLEQLRFAAGLLSSSFETALRERVAQLAPFRHPCYARVRRVDRLDGGASLALVSEHPRGARLADVLAVAERDSLDLDINAALCVVRQLVPAIAALHQASAGAAHGALSPDRIIVTPHGRIVITEHVVGQAIEGLRLSRDELWRDLRILVPVPGEGACRLDRRADIVQIGAVSLALVLGRPLRPGELDALPELLGTARETTVLGKRELVAAPLRRWLLRALQLDSRGSFQSAADAQEGLDDVLSEEGGYIAAPLALESFLTRYQEHATRPAASPSAADTRQGPNPASVSLQVIPAPVATPPVPAPSRENAPAEPAEAAELHSPAPVLTLVSAEPSAPDDRLAVTGEVGPTEDAPRTEEGIKPAERVELKQFLETIDVDSTPPEDVAAASRASAGVVERVVEAVTENEGDAYLEESSPARRVTRERIALVLCALVAVGEAVYIGTSSKAATPAASEGRVSVDSRPTGATVIIDDRERGVTPLSLSLPPGAHALALRTEGSSRAVPLMIQAGVTYAQYIELAPAVTTGSIDVVAETPGARVLLDGQPRGVSPMTIADVPPGDHDVVIENGSHVVRQRVAVQAGLTTSVRATSAEPAAAAPEAGWVTVVVPFQMQVFEAGRLLGTTSTSRLPLAPGQHTLQIVSEALNFRTRAAVDVVAGRELRVPVSLPKGSVAINATPWAEVWIDGTRAGETPIGNLALTLGPHELVFKHPDYPERRHAVSVTAGAPTRVSVEMQP